MHKALLCEGGAVSGKPPESTLGENVGGQVPHYDISLMADNI